MAKDKFHDAVRRGLEKEGWTITADPYALTVEGVDFEIDLAAESLLGADRDGQKIAVEVKSFVGSSNTSEFHTALGQFLNYRDALAIADPDRILFLAIRETTHETFFKRRFIANSVERYQLRIVVYDSQKEVIVQWL
jgi:hypothetical protein